MRYLSPLFFVFICFPLLVDAHAVPITYTPEELSVLPSFPSEIGIRFSERVEPTASSITLFPPSGTPTTLTRLPSDDERYYRATLEGDVVDAQGVYTVSWQVVSADDGHFTRGAFQFVVGTGTPSHLNTTQVQVVHSSGLLEATTIALKLIGESMIIGILFLLWYFGRSTQVSDALRLHLGIYAGRLYRLGIAVLFIGGLSYLFLKVRMLAQVQEIGFWDALVRVLPTTAGTMTIALLFLVIVFLFISQSLFRRLLQGERLSVREVSALCVLLLISYTQARLSHAAASHVLPTFSVLMNIPHLLGKGLWVGGILGAVFVVYPALARTPSEHLFRHLARRALGYATAAAVLLGGISGSWIVWLHLKQWGNLLTTTWGQTFLFLVFFAGILLLLRLLALLVLDRRTRCLNCEWSFLMLEGLVGLAVSFLSAVMIITTPPLTYAPLWMVMSADRGAMVHLSDPGDGQNTLRIEGFDARGLLVKNAHVVVTLTHLEKGIGPIVVTPRGGEGKWEIPASLLSPPGKWEIHVALSPPGAYDLNGRFIVVYPDDVEQVRTIALRPSWNMFTFSMIGIAVALIILACLIFWLVRRNAVYASAHPEIFSPAPALRLWTGWMSAIIIFLLLVVALQFAHRMLLDSTEERGSTHHQMMHH